MSRDLWKIIESSRKCSLVTFLIFFQKRYQIPREYGAHLPDEREHMKDGSIKPVELANIMGVRHVYPGRLFNFAPIVLILAPLER